MKTKMIAYWVTTSLIALETLAGCIVDLTHGQTGQFLGPLVLATLALSSWALRPPSRALGPIFQIRQSVQMLYLQLRWRKPKAIRAARNSSQIMYINTLAAPAG